MSSYGKNLRSALPLKSSKKYNLMKSAFKDWESMTQIIHTAYSKHISSKFDSDAVLGIHVLNCTSCNIILKIIVEKQTSHKS